MKTKNIPPTFEAEAFNCPHCHAFAKQHWYYIFGNSNPEDFGITRNFPHFFSCCEYCNESTIWYDEKIIFPQSLSAEPPNSDLPEEIIDDYNEARAILNLSPRGAAALLRLSIQKLCKHLGQPGNNINSDIQALVALGLPNKVQEALDCVRVIGNEAVHPGTIDLKDDRDTANQLFKLVNFIVQKMITEPREIDEMYNSLPEDKLKGIKSRDK